MAMAVTSDADRLLRFAARRLRMASVARPRQRHVELALDHGMDELANPIAQATLRSDQTSCRKDKQPSRL